MGGGGGGGQAAFYVGYTENLWLGFLNYTSLGVLAHNRVFGVKWRNTEVMPGFRFTSKVHMMKNYLGF